MAGGDRNIGIVGCLFVAIGGGLASCDDIGPCDRSDQSHEAQPYRAGASVDGFYMSSPWTGPLLPFGPGQRYQVFHGLGQTPKQIGCWVSFQDNGLADGTMAPAAGNLCVVQQVTDEYVQIKNDTCAEMFVLVTASAPAARKQLGDASTAP